MLGPCVPGLPTGEEARCLSSEQRAVFLLSPSLSPLSFSGVKRSSLFSFSPQIWLLITPQTLSRIDFSSVRRVFFVCLRQRVSWLKAAFPKVAAMGVFHPHLPRAAPLLLAGDGNCRSVLGRPESLPGSLARGMPAWVSRLLSGFCIELGLQTIPFNERGMMTNTPHFSLSSLTLEGESTLLNFAWDRNQPCRSPVQTRVMPTLSFG